MQSSKRPFLVLISTLLIAACGGGGSSSDVAPQAQTNPPAVTPDSSGGGGSGSTLSLDFSSSTPTVDSGQTFSLIWSSAGAQSCEADGGWDGTRELEGNEEVGPITESTTYSLSCSSASGSILREVRVLFGTTTPPPPTAVDDSVTVSLSVDSEYVRLGESVNVIWDSENASSCQADGTWSGDVALRGNVPSPPLTANAAFKLTCFGQGSSAVALVTVSVAGSSASWTAPDEYTDGSTLGEELAGYTASWRSTSGGTGHSQTLPASATTFSLPSGFSGFYVVTLRSFDKAGISSLMSNEIVLYGD